MQRRKRTRHVFQLSGFSNNVKTELGLLIKNLGGIYSESERFQDNCTHIVCRKPYRSEKFLAGCATGKWLVTTDYLYQSYRHGRWLEEQPYEWCMQMKDRVPEHLYPLLRAPSKWRTSLLSGKKPFTGWRAVVLVENIQRKVVYKSLLDWGGAMVTMDLRLPMTNPEGVARKITHVFSEDKFEKTLKVLQKFGVLCVYPVYIGDFLVMDQSPDPELYIIGGPGSCNKSEGDGFNVSQSSPMLSQKPKALLQPKQKLIVSQPSTARLKPVMQTLRKSARILKNLPTCQIKSDLDDFETYRRLPEPNVKPLATVQQKLNSNVTQSSLIHQKPMLQHPRTSDKISQKIPEIRSQLSQKPLAKIFDCQKTTPVLSPTAPTSTQKTALHPARKSARILKRNSVNHKKNRHLNSPGQAQSSIRQFCVKTDVSSAESDCVVIAVTRKPVTEVANNSAVSNTADDPVIVKSPVKTNQHRPVTKPVLYSSQSHPNLPETSSTGEEFDGKVDYKLHSRGRLKGFSKRPLVSIQKLTEDEIRQYTCSIENSESSRNTTSTPNNSRVVTRLYKRLSELETPSEKCPIVISPLQSSISDCVEGSGHVGKRKIQDAEELEKALIEVKRQKLETDVPFVPSLIKPSEVSSGAAESFQVSDYATAIFGVCLEEHHMTKALDVVLGSLSMLIHPQPRTLHQIITQILLPSQSADVSYKAYSVLQRVMTVHPPTGSRLQAVYLQALRPGASLQADPGAEWNLIHSSISFVVSSDRKAVAEQRNHVLFLKFLIGLLESDFHSFRQRLLSDESQQGKKRKTNPGRCMLQRILWRNTESPQLNLRCQNLISKLMEALELEENKIEIVSLIQRLVEMAAECCRLSNSSRSQEMSLQNLPQTAVTFARELAYRIRGDVDDLGDFQLILRQIQLPWMTAKICEYLLDLYDDSLLPYDQQETHNILSLKRIVSHYFYLLPPAATGISKSPHAKQFKKKFDNTDLQTVQRLTNENLPFDNKSKETRRSSRNVNKRNAKGEMALHIACAKNRVAKVRELLQTPGIHINMKDYGGWTALHEACNHGNIEVVRELLRYKPAKTITSYFKHDKTCEERLDLMPSSSDGITPLHDAVRNNHVDVAELLLATGGEQLLSAVDKEGRTPLDMAFSDEMKHILRHDIQNTCMTPRKKKRLFGSPGLPSPVLSSKTVLQPSEEVYLQTVGVGAKQIQISAKECSKYIILLLQLLKSYIQAHNLMSIASVLKTDKDRTEVMNQNSRHSDTNIVMESNSCKTQESDSNLLKQSKIEWVTPEKEPLTIDSSQNTIQPESPLINVRRSRRISRPTEKALGNSALRFRRDDCLSRPSTARNEPRQGVDEKSSSDSLQRVEPNDIEWLREDIVVLRDLDRHVRGLQQHTERIMGNNRHGDVTHKLLMLTVLCKSISGR